MASCGGVESGEAQGPILPGTIDGHVSDSVVGQEAIQAVLIKIRLAGAADQV